MFKRKHIHEWSPWHTEIRKNSKITKMSGFVSQQEFTTCDELVNIRTCILPRCRYTEERKA